MSDSTGTASGPGDDPAGARVDETTDSSGSVRDDGVHGRVQPDVPGGRVSDADDGGGDGGDHVVGSGRDGRADEEFEPDALDDGELGDGAFDGDDAFPLDEDVRPASGGVAAARLRDDGTDRDGIAAAQARGAAGGGSVAVRDPRSTAARRGPVTRVRSIGTFYRQVVAELRKVIWPTRQELITYTSVVIVFVVVMVLIVSIFDFAFSKAVLKVFGDSSL